jgi:hypothetical protein
MYSLLGLILQLTLLLSPLPAGPRVALVRGATPTNRPTTRPSPTPTAKPSTPPTAVPSIPPSPSPTTARPTPKPSTAQPSRAPTRIPTAKPTREPTSTPTTTPKSFLGYYSLAVYYAGASCFGDAMTTTYVIGNCVNVTSDGLQQSYYYNYTNSSGTIDLYYFLYSTEDCSGPTNSGFPELVDYSDDCTQPSSSDAYQQASITDVLPTYSDGVIVS